MDKELDFYQLLRAKIKNWEKKEGKNHKWAEYILLAPDFFHLLCKLAIDPNVPNKEKAKLAGAIVYFIPPVDVVPEALIGPVGYVDDIALSAYVLNSIINSIGPEHVSKYWAGEANLLDLIKKILKIADEMIGAGLWKKIKKFIESK